MREIKFRGRDDYRSWHYGDLWNIHKSDYVIISHTTDEAYPVLPETIGQYTGMKDKNGTEIYEGDILGSDYGSNGVMNFGRYTQPFNDDDNTCHIGFYVDWGCYDLFRQDVGYWSKSCTVIGNIHDNPEIMEEQV